MTELFSLLTQDIPETQKPPVGFLEIINKQYHENINSTLYAHFINCEEKAVSDLFLNALIELIEEKTTKSFSFGKVVAVCELTTEKGRIDIVIKDQFSQQTIIIENKIFHWLHNDLLDYWNHFKIPDNQKAGILLTPEKHSIPNNVRDYFVNITHGEWISKIKDKGLSFGLSNKYTIYVSDFVQTIENLTKSHDMNEQSKFYFQHAQKILKIQKTTAAAHQFLNQQLQLIASKLGWQTYGNAMEWRNFWDEQNHLDTYLTIITKPLLRGEMKFTLILELMRKDMEKASELEMKIKDHPQFKKMRKGNPISKTQLHFGMIEYHISPNDLDNFAEIVYQKILEDFADVTVEAIKHFYPDKDISAWEKHFIAPHLLNA